MDVRKLLRLGAIYVVTVMPQLVSALVFTPRIETTVGTVHTQGILVPQALLLSWWTKPCAFRPINAALSNVYGLWLLGANLRDVVTEFV